MTVLFLKIINMSISASWLILAVLILRFVFKKAPKWINVLLWGIVAVRLIFPFSIESALSLVPSAETIRPEIMMDKAPIIHSGIPAINSAVNPVISEFFAPAPGASANPLQIWIPILAVIWTVAAAVLLVYTAVSYWHLRRKVSEAVIFRNNIFQSENVGFPFVLGIIKPRIYLPYNMDGQDLNHVVAHEQAHIRRRDHWWKPLGFLLLTIHWFNPLMWLAYVLLCRDIELACDEKVIKELSNEQRADYTQALVACSVNRRMIAACPLAFGEVGVKERVRSVMNYKKPAFWIVFLAIITCVAAAVCFLTNPAANDDDFSEVNSSLHDQYFSKQLTLDDVRELSQKGNELVWSNFNEFRYYETGSGLYIRVYEIDEVFSLWIGGSGPNHELEPMYIYLALNNDFDTHIDIRDGNVEEFIARYGTSPTEDKVNSILWNGELIPGTTYVSYQCLYMNPLSSYAAVGGDSGYKYIVGEDYFATINRTDDSFVSVTHSNLDTVDSGLDSLQNMINVSKWEWQEFPYTDEEWAALYKPAGSESADNISEYYDEMLYQCLTPGKFLLKMDSSLWLAELASDEQMGTYLWSIYSLVPESAMGVAQ